MEEKQLTTNRPPIPVGPPPMSRQTTIDKRLIAQNMTMLRSCQKGQASYDTVGKRLKAGRQLAAYSQYTVAESIGRTKSTVSGYEADRLEPLDADLRCLAKLFYLPYEWLKNGDPLEGGRTEQSSAWVPDVPQTIKNDPVAQFGAGRGGAGA